MSKVLYHKPNTNMQTHSFRKNSKEHVRSSDFIIIMYAGTQYSGASFCIDNQPRQKRQKRQNSILPQSGGDP